MEQLNCLSQKFPSHSQPCRWNCFFPRAQVLRLLSKPKREVISRSFTLLAIFWSAYQEIKGLIQLYIDLIHYPSIYVSHYFCRTIRYGIGPPNTWVTLTRTLGIDVKKGLASATRGRRGRKRKKRGPRGRNRGDGK